MKKIIQIILIFLIPSICTGQNGTQPPYPYSTYISGVEFAPESTIVRLAKGSDNFPITWADDDHLYTTYGDGWGFEPMMEDKLSLGFARITGYPPDHHGENILSTGERYGDGESGEKGSGILMVDGVLYIWLMHADRNGGQSRLARSDDYLKTVTMSDWLFEEFGTTTFINYGKNYAGSRDDYVYSVAHDNKIAKLPADHFILMRVAKQRIMQREAYEFYVENDDAGNPVWTKDIAKRGPAFRHRNNCQRSSITYNAGLKRYLWWQQIPNHEHPKGDMGDTRFEGGFGIYEAPEPWGPWRTVYYTEQWDVGPGEIANFPSKWMSADGKTCYMTFSGDDHFSVRKLIFYGVH